MARFLQYGSRGDSVRSLQKLLNDSPKFGIRHKLVVDGEMGTLTCAAVQQAKFRLGYEKHDMDPDVKDQIAGTRLFALLSGKEKLPVEYQKRRSRRLKMLARQRKANSRLSAVRHRALDIIHGELGTMERDGGQSNRIKYNDWWGWGAVAYCVIGVSWAWVRAGSKAFLRGSRWAGTDLMLSDAKAGRNGLHLTSDPDPGCPGVIDFDGHSDPDHAITFVRNNGDGTCETFEFNTTGPNGLGGVWREDRPLRNCWWFEVER